MKKCFENPLPKSGDIIRIVETNTKDGAQIGEEMMVADAYIVKNSYFLRFYEGTFMVIKVLRRGNKSLSYLRSCNYKFEILNK